MPWSLILFFGLCVANSGKTHPPERDISQAEVRAVIQAVQDEIYDYGYEEDYAIDRNGQSTSGTEREIPLSLYLRPQVEHGEGAVIYVLNGYGEVYRLYHLRPDGLVVLDGDPELGFPPTQPSRKVIFMDAPYVKQLKARWRKESFFVEAAPSRGAVRDAAKRQKERTGYSYWESVVLPHLDEGAP